jgi:hypothetical protein
MKMEKIRPGLRWVAAAVFHFILLIILFKVGEAYFGDAPVKPSDIQLAEWSQQTRTFLFAGAGVSFALFIIWNIVFHLIVSDAHVKIRWLFWIALVLDIVAEALCVCVYLSHANVSEWGTTVFSAAMVFYLTPVLNIIPFALSLLFCSPSVIDDPRGWFRI